MNDQTPLDSLPQNFSQEPLRNQNLSPKKIWILCGVIFITILIGLYGIFYFWTKKVSFTVSNPRFTEEASEDILNRAYLPGEQLNFHIDLGPVQLNKEGNPDVVVVFTAQDQQGNPIADPYIFTHRENPEKTKGPLHVPLHFFITIPVNIEGGTYDMVYDAKDLVQGASTEGKYSFQIRAPQKKSDAQLSIELLSFVSGNKSIPTDQNSFSPGTSIKATFYAVGFKRDDKDLADLRLSLEVRNSKGDILTANPDLVHFQEKLLPEDFFVPMNISLTIPPEVPAGDYKISLKLNDDTSKKEVEATLPFRIDL